MRSEGVVLAYSQCGLRQMIEEEVMTQRFSMSGNRVGE